MKLIRFGEKGEERPGVLDAEGRIRDVSSVVPDFSPDTIGPELIDTLSAADLSALPAVDPTTRIGAPLSRTGHFIAIGLNYADHAAEAGLQVPAEPIVFSKAPSSLNGPNDDVMLPRGSTNTDWEVELAAIIGTRCDYVSQG